MGVGSPVIGGLKTAYSCLTEDAVSPFFVQTADSLQGCLTAEKQIQSDLNGRIASLEAELKQIKVRKIIFLKFVNEVDEVKYCG